MSGPYRRKTKARFLIPVVVVCLILAMALLSTSVYMSRHTRHVIDGDTLELVQLDKPKKGDEIAVIKTSLGTMKAVLYPEYAPKTVENFKKLAESGYYDNTYIYDIVDGTYFNAGAPNKSGTLDKTKDSGDERIELEYSQNLWPLRGAVYSCTTEVEKGVMKQVMNRAKRYGGSRFGICDSIEMTDEVKENLYGDKESDAQNKIADAFVKKGGVPNFSQQVTIFAQVYDGLDVIDKITSQKTENDTNYNGYKNPLKNITIKSIKIEKYK